MFVLCFFHGFDGVGRPLEDEAVVAAVDQLSEAQMRIILVFFNRQE